MEQEMEFIIISSWIIEHTRYVDMYDGSELMLPLVTREQIQREQERVQHTSHLVPDLAVNYTATWTRDNLTIYVDL